MMQDVYTAPDPLINIAHFKLRVFLAGTIDEGNSNDWQKDAIKKLRSRFIKRGIDACIMNPRRERFIAHDQTIRDPHLYRQVKWELTAMDRATHIIINILPDSKSPITLLEFGLHAKEGKVMIVCPDEFYRKGNVDIVCEHYGVLQYPSIDELIANLH